MKTPRLSFLCICAIVTLCIASCVNTSTEEIKTSVTRARYARLFTYQEDSLYTYVNVYLPQDTTQVFRTYLLHRQDTPPPVGADTIAVHIPLKEIGCAHSTQIGFIKALDELERITCVGDVNLLE
ncbi:MAG: hypothetical protein II371_00245 [Flavobacteriales bacterium]|nr:hypothetical protein [Flavobacteriales bacterium]